MRPASARPGGSTPRSIVERRLAQQNSQAVMDNSLNQSPPKYNAALTPQVASRRREQSIQAAILRGSNTALGPVRKGGSVPLQTDEQTTRTAWRAFGSYIAKQMLNGKGVVVPHFGTFSFTAMNVDLAGTTNPQQRDKQLREPVFMVGKDFVNNIAMKKGIAHTWGDVRPFDLKGANGIIPQVKINWVEVAVFGGIPKETAKEACEQMFRQMADNLRSGKPVNTEIPLVGRFVTRGTIAAVSFLPSLVEGTLGTTAKQFTVGKLFSSSNNVLNMNIHKDEDIKKNPSFMNGGSLGISNDATGWLKNNLDIDLDAFNNEPAGDLVNTEDPADVYAAGKIGVPAGPKSLGRTLSGARGASRQYLPNRTNMSSHGLERQPPPRSRSGLALQRPPSAGGYSGVPSSHMSMLPQADRVSVMAYASQVYSARKSIMTHLTNPQSKIQLRDLLSSSQIQSVLKKCGCYLEIVPVKQLLRELGFPFNGASASFTSILIATRAFLHGNGAGVGRGNGLRSDASLSAFSGHPGDLKADQALGDSSPRKQNGKKVVFMLRDLFYSTRKNLYELFRQGNSSRKTLDLAAFTAIVDFASQGTVPASAAETAFVHLVASATADMTYEQFERAFRSEVPTGQEFETVVIRKIREWMFRNRLSSEMAFESLCRASSRHSERTLPRACFHEAFSHFEIGLSAAQIDALFSTLTGGKGEEVSLVHWQSRIYEDGDNPLQAMRETVQQMQLTQDDLLFQMKLRVWDEPLDGKRFLTAIRLLDQTVSDAQAKALFAALKNNDGRVDVHILVRNLTGREFETVDFRNKIFSKIYSEVFPHQEERMISLLQEEDGDNLGLLRGAGLLKVLNQIVKTVSKSDLERFVRFLDKDKLGRVSYMEFMGKMGKSNKSHNPFKTIVSRIAFFLKQNNVEIPALLTRLAQSIEGSQERGSGNWAIPIDGFTAFLKQKVEKKRDIGELRKFTTMIDIDKDGFITDPDLSTCVKNLSNSAFFRKGGEALKSSSFNQKARPFPKASRLSADKAKEVCTQIREAMGVKQISYRSAFDNFDLNKDGMVSFAELQRGLQSICPISQPVLEQLYALMDHQKIGLVSYEAFLAVLKNQQFEAPKISDNFDWENSMIQKIRSWIAQKRYTVEEAFKCFDKDFDGYISKTDLKQSLITLLEVPAAEIYSTKLDRLYRLMDFFKQGQIQLSDFTRLLTQDNPYSSTAIQGTSNNMSRSLGGGLSKTSTFDWKFSAVQQLGLVCSKKYSSSKASFDAASGGKNTVNFTDFNNFVDQHHALEGFNLTMPLMQKLFAEIDAHKKGHLNFNDWNSAFGVFKLSEQILVELKNILKCSFADAESAYNFFLTFNETNKKPKTSIPQESFNQAVKSLTSGRFKQKEVTELWNSLTNGNSNGLDQHSFRSHFESLAYTGKAQIKTIKALAGSSINSQNASMRGTSTTKAGRTTIQTTTSSSQNWEHDVMEKLKQIIKSSSINLRQVFNSMDVDGNGFITQVEFRNAIRQLGLGLTSREIDQLLASIDSNSDGKICWSEFAAKFTGNELDERMADRAKSRMGQLKELMILHMTSPNDAFRFYDKERDDRLTFNDFSSLVTKAHQLGNLTVPAYPVMKDLFDLIDIRQDGLIDLTEWQQTFGRVTEGNNQLTLKPTALSTWENSAEYEKIGNKIAKNRKQLVEEFKKVLGPSGTEFTFAQGKEALDGWLESHFKNTLDDEKLKCIFRAAQVHSKAQGQPQYDYQRLFEIFRGRHARPQF